MKMGKNAEEHYILLNYSVTKVTVENQGGNPSEKSSSTSDLNVKMVLFDDYCHVFLDLRRTSNIKAKEKQTHIAEIFHLLPSSLYQLL